MHYLGKKNMGFQAVITVLLTAALWARAFVSPTPMAACPCYAPFYNWVYEQLVSLPYLCSAVALLLVLLEGLWLNSILYNYKSLPQNNLQPMLFYALAMSVGPHTITPILLANIALIAGLSQLLTHGPLSIDLNKSFNALFCIGVATLIYAPSFVLVIPYLFVCTFYKLYSWNDIAILFLGLAAPIIPFAIAHLFLGDLAFAFYQLINAPTQLALPWHSLEIKGAIVLALLFIFTLVCMFETLSQSKLQPMSVQKNFQVISILMLASVLVMLYANLFPLSWQAWAIPFAFVATHFFLAPKNKWWIDDACLLALIATLASNEIF